ncbi:unnamed protein product [Sphagnum balticum]
MLVVGVDAIKQDAKLLASIHELAESLRQKCADKDATIVNILHRHTGQVNALDIGYRAGFASTFASAHPQLLYLCGADELSQLNREQLTKDGTFVVYQGHHGDAGAELADVVFPGRAQRAYAAVSPPGLARVDWKIIRALSEVAGRTLAYSSLAEVRARMSQVAPHLTRAGAVENVGAFAKVAANMAKVSVGLIRRVTPLIVHRNPRCRHWPRVV